jgi:hypothetical protein
MHIESVTCAVCDEPVGLDDDRVEIEAEHLPRREFANIDEFAAHPDCWDEMTATWSEPA